jgi:hypothetical protein
MIQKVVKKHSLGGFSEVRQNLGYWLSKTPQERLEAVDFLRSQIYGNTERLQRVARVIQRSQS